MRWGTLPEPSRNTPSVEVMRLAGLLTYRSTRMPAFPVSQWLIWQRSRSTVAGAVVAGARYMVFPSYIPISSPDFRIFDGEPC